MGRGGWSEWMDGYPASVCGHWLSLEWEYLYETSNQSWNHAQVG